jgi:hypothetical protein
VREVGEEEDYDDDDDCNNMYMEATVCWFYSLFNDGF